MIKPKSPKYLSRILRETSVTKSDRLEEENRKLRLQVEELREMVRKERRRADLHADEIAVMRQSQALMARRSSWGPH
jgi:hypothetical protein